MLFRLGHLSGRTYAYTFIGIPSLSAWAYVHVYTSSRKELRLGAVTHLPFKDLFSFRVAMSVTSLSLSKLVCTLLRLNRQHGVKHVPMLLETILLCETTLLYSLGNDAQRQS